MDRYDRQTRLKGFGQEKQALLQQAKVLVIGAGGLGVPVLQYLTAMGVGTIGIAEHDTVSITNLQRQVLYYTSDEDQPKLSLAVERLKQLNPTVRFREHDTWLQTDNALEIVGAYDVVVDCSDNFGTRYLINDACVITGKPLVYGAIYQYEGQVSVFNYQGGATYRCIFPEPPEAGQMLNCSEIGVLGVLPGIVGCYQANETVKIITGIGKPLCNTIVSYNALTNLFYEFSISPAKEMNLSIPKNQEEFRNFNYDWFCGTHEELNEITPAEFDTLKVREKIDIIDVREIDELPEVDEFLFTKIPLSKFEEALKDISTKNDTHLISDL